MQKTNILLVDDDEIYLYVVKSYIDRISDRLEVKSFTDGEKAIEFLRLCTANNVQLPSVILLDINMPYLDGWGFLAEFRNLKPKINEKVHIYLVTSSQRQRDQKRAEEFEELTGYVIKPISEDRLIEILNEANTIDW